MKVRSLNLAISTAIFLTACGGGGSGSNGNSTSSSIGYVGDGYIQGAYVCHDLNDNLSCVDEGTANYTTTDANGEFDNANIANYDASQNLLVEVPIGAQDNGPFVDTSATAPRIVNAPVWFVLPSGSTNAFASPFSTLIFSVMQRDPSLTITQAEDLVKARLGLGSSSVSLFDDYLTGSTQNSQLHVFAEVITSALLENMGDLQSQSFSESEKLWYASQYVYQNLGNLIVSLPNPIPANFDGSNYDSPIRFSQTPTEFASQLVQIGARGAVINVDACTRITQGLYAYEHWRSLNAITDDAYGTGPDTDSEVKTISLDIITNKLYQTSFEYQYAGVGTPAWDTRTSSTVDGYLIDTTNLTGPRATYGDIALFDTENTGCVGNQASFARADGLVEFDFYINAVDISGDAIVGHYPDLELELRNVNNPTVVFPPNSEKLSGQFYLTQDVYAMGDDDNDTQITDFSGSALTSISWSSISAGDSYYFEQLQSQLTIDSVVTNGSSVSGLATHTDNRGTPLNTLDDVITSGSWQLVGTGVNQFLQTNISMDDDITSQLFIAGVAGALRAGEKTPAGTTLFVGNPYEDIMDDIMFNKTAHFAIVNGINNADADGDYILNVHDSDDDNDGVLDSVDDFSLNANEDTDTDGDGIGDNADTDADNDGVLDGNDAFPLDNTESVDTDGDTIGNNADSDDDGDNLSDIDEINTYGTNPLLADTDGDAVNDNLDAAPLDPNVQ